jgi:tRNA G37 N-methylase TrmD
MQACLMARGTASELTRPCMHVEMNTGCILMHGMHAHVRQYTGGCAGTQEARVHLTQKDKPVKQQT